MLGGGGFIGSAVCDALLIEGYQVRVFERPRVPPYRFFAEDERVEWIVGDSLSAADIDAALNGVDLVIHLVSTTLPKGSNQDAIFDVQTNVVGTLQLLNAMVRRSVSRIVFISSGGTVYGPPRCIPVPEDHATEPTVSYGVTKLAIEKYLSIYSAEYGLQSTVLRVANPYGARQRVETAQGAVGVFVAKALRNEVIEVWGNGSVIRDYIHVRDVAAAFCAAVMYPSSGHRVFNVGSGQGKSLLELITAVQRYTSQLISVEFLPPRLFDIPVNVLDISKANQQLFWQPAVSFESGIEETVRWYDRFK